MTDVGVEIVEMDKAGNRRLGGGADAARRVIERSSRRVVLCRSGQRLCCVVCVGDPGVRCHRRGDFGSKAVHLVITVDDHADLWCQSLAVILRLFNHRPASRLIAVCPPGAQAYQYDAVCGAQIQLMAQHHPMQVAEPIGEGSLVPRPQTCAVLRTAR